MAVVGGTCVSGHLIRHKPLVSAVFDVPVPAVLVDNNCNSIGC